MFRSRGAPSAGGRPGEEKDPHQLWFLGMVIKVPRETPPVKAADQRCAHPGRRCVDSGKEMCRSQKAGGHKPCDAFT